MELSLAALADAANISNFGKLNVLGIFQAIYTHEVPLQHPVMHLVLVFRMSAGEKGSPITIKVVLTDADGQILGTPPELIIEVPAEHPGSPEFPLLIAIKNLVLPRFGDYRFDILVNGLTVGNIPLHIIPASPLVPNLELG